MAYIFWISLAFIIYTYFIYPIIIVASSRIAGRSARLSGVQGDPPSVSLIIVVYNEEERIEEKLENCRRLDYPHDRLQICFVSDGSTDRSVEILRRQSDIFFIEDDTNRGKPYQINRAVKWASGEILVFSDVRQTFEVDAIRKLVRNFGDDKVGAVSGELVFRPSKDHTERSIGLYWRYEKMLRKAESALDSTLGVTGAIYAIRRDLFEPIPIDTILDDVEIPLRIFKRGFRVVFDQEAVAYDTASSDYRMEFRRKVRTLGGNIQLFQRNSWLLNPFRNKIFIQTISHKYFRLLIPYALIMAFVASGSIPKDPYKVFFWIQAIVYSMGIVSLLNEDIRTKPLLNVITVFMTLNAAAVVALYRYLFGRIDIRWKQ